MRELAVMDWANTPSATIREHFGSVSYQTISRYRESDIYKETWAMCRTEWMEEIGRLPQTADLKKKISQGMALSLNVLIEILGGKAQHKDKISAARLMSQLDGRFLHSADDDPDPSRAGQSLAAELLGAIERQQRVQ